MLVKDRVPDVQVNNGQIGVRGLISKVVVNAFYFFTILLVPVSLPPAVWGGSGQALAQTSTFRAYLLAASLVFGILAFFVVSDSRFSDLFKRRKPSAWVLALLCLIVWLVASAANPSLGPWGSALGDPGRMDGALIQASWFALVLVSYGVMRGSRAGPNVLIRWLTAAALLTAAWTFLQGIGRDPLEYLAGVYLNVPAGAFGHGGYASTFLAVAVLVLASVWVKRKDIGLARYGVFLVLGIGMAAGGGRAAVVGLLVGSVLLAMANRRDLRALRRLGMLASLLVSGMLLAFVLVDRTQAQAVNMVAAAQGKDRSLNGRFAAWRGGTQLLLENPLLGVGTGGFEYGVWPLLSENDAATLIRDPLGTRVEGLALEPESYTISGGIIAIVDNQGEFLVTRLGWDKAHNYFLDLALAAGIPAMIFYALFVIAAFIALWSSNSELSVGMACALVAFVVFGLGWFGTISVDPVIWVLVGGGLALSTPQVRASPA